MANSAKYVVLSSGEVSYVELGFDFSELSLSGQSIELLGSGAVDAVKLGDGVALDFSLSGSSQDKIYFSSDWSEYAQGLTFPEGETGFAMSLGSETGGAPQTALFRRGFTPAISDNLIFTDGVINARTMASDKAASVPDASNETTLDPDLPNSFGATIKMVSFDNSGLTFAPVANGMEQIVLGGSGADIVYVGDGGISDASALAGGKDQIYLRGNFADYSKDVSVFGQITLTRDHDGNSETPLEQVTVAASFGGNDDMLVFADGAVSSTRALRTELAGASDPDEVTIGDLGSAWDAGTITPGVSSAPYVVAFGASSEDGVYKPGDTILITAEMNEDVLEGSTFEATLNTGAVVTLAAAEEGALLSGAYIVGPSDSTGDLAVVSFSAGGVTDLEGNPMTSTSLPSVNIDDAHDIIVNDLALESAVAGVTELDARSDIVLSASGGEELRLTAVDGVYEIGLVELAGDGEKDGFSGEDGDGSQTLTVTVSNGAAVFDGGVIKILDGKAIVDFARDFDLANRFSLEVDAGLFIGEGGLASGGVGDSDIVFDTVTPTVGGALSQVWDGAGVSDGSVWYDGTGGNYLSNEVGLDLDLSAVAGVVVLGRDMDETSSIALLAPSNAHLVEFGADDRLYVDQSVTGDVNAIDEYEISFVSVDGGAPTVLLFSGIETQGAAFITLTDNPDTTNLDESVLAATAFLQSTIPAGAPDYSFEQLLQSTQAPVISG